MAGPGVLRCESRGAGNGQQPASWLPGYRVTVPPGSLWIREGGGSVPFLSIIRKRWLSVGRGLGKCMLRLLENRFVEEDLPPQ